MVLYYNAKETFHEFEIGGERFLCHGFDCVDIPEHLTQFVRSRGMPFYRADEETEEQENARYEYHFNCLTGWHDYAIDLAWCNKEPFEFFIR